jgi:hypothetical protein
MKVELKQKHWLLNLPMFIQRLYTKTYCPQGMVQFDENGMTICGDRIKWLDEFQITALSKKSGDKLAFDYLKNKYPEYKNYIQLF